MGATTYTSCNSFARRPRSSVPGGRDRFARRAGPGAGESHVHEKQDIHSMYLFPCSDPSASFPEDKNTSGNHRSECGDAEHADRRDSDRGFAGMVFLLLENAMPCQLKAGKKGENLLSRYSLVSSNVKFTGNFKAQRKSFPVERFVMLIFFHFINYLSTNNMQEIMVIFAEQPMF